MSVRRAIGIETEYGILDVADPAANPMLLSAQVVTAYARDGLPGLAQARWDYQDEDPLADARGWRLDREQAHPSQLTDTAPDIWDITRRHRLETAVESEVISNALLPNGGRYYVDHAHPEYSSPEVTNPLDLVLWDKAGDEIALRSTRLLAQRPGMPEVALYKNNTDGKGASYGTHENYLMDRAVPFSDVITALMPFLVTRPVFAGSGRVGLGQTGEQAGFQLTQRADFIEAQVGLETTLRRPIINTRDEPHADATRYRRLHVIVGDANQMDVPTYLKFGTTSLVLWLLEREGIPPELAPLALADPVHAARQVSHDLTLRRPLELADGSTMTALDIQRRYAEVISAAVGSGGDEATTAVLTRWISVLDRLARDPAECAREVEWVAKRRVLEAMARRDHLNWDHPRLAALDLQWSDLRPERSVYRKLAQAGAVETLVTADQIEHAIGKAPTDTRAYFRGECLRRYGAAVNSANWDAVIFDIPGHSHLQRVPISDPYRGSAAYCAELLDEHPDPSDLLAALAN